MSNFVLVLDTNRKPLAPCGPGVARTLLNRGKAAVFRMYPFTIILNKAIAGEPTKVELKIDPGSKTTGMAILNGNQVVFGLELTHRGDMIRKKLEQRAACRRGRRNRNTRYRQARFLNRTKPKGWLAPSLVHRVQTTMTWVRRLQKFCSVGNIVMELVRFDMQKIQNPEIEGAEYQQGELAGYEVREYLLEKWNRTCAYCGKKDVPLQIEHVHPKSKGGSNRISNLTLACGCCNQKKSDKPIEVFLAKKPDLLKSIKAKCRLPLKDAAAVNATRWLLFNTLSETGLEVTVGTGGQTKWNRTRLGVEKSHWMDAACVGRVGSLDVKTGRQLVVVSRGQGGRQKCMTDRFGYPKQHRSLKPIDGWRSGDIVKFEGETYALTPRVTGSFKITDRNKVEKSKPSSKISLLHRMDGYRYAF